MPRSSRKRSSRKRSSRKRGRPKGSRNSSKPKSAGRPKKRLSKKPSKPKSGRPKKRLSKKPSKPKSAGRPKKRSSKKGEVLSEKNENKYKKMNHENSLSLAEKKNLEQILEYMSNHILDEKHRSDDMYDFNKYPQSSILKFRDLKNILYKKMTYEVIEPQSYTSITTLNNKSFMFEDTIESKFGYFYGGDDDDDWATSGSGADVWLIANKSLLTHLQKLYKKWNK